MVFMEGPAGEQLGAATRSTGSAKKPRTGKRLAAKGCLKHLQLLTSQGSDLPFHQEQSKKRRNSDVVDTSSGLQQPCSSDDSQPTSQLYLKERAWNSGADSGPEEKVKQGQDDKFEGLLTGVRACTSLPSESMLATVCANLDETAVDGLIAVLQSYKEGLGEKAAPPTITHTCGDDKMAPGGPEVINEGTAAQQLLLLASAADEAEDAGAKQKQLEEAPVSGNSVSSLPAASCGQKHNVGVIMEMDVEVEGENSSNALLAKDDSLSLGRLDIKSQTSGETAPNAAKTISKPLLVEKQATATPCPNFIRLEGHTFAVLPSKAIHLEANAGGNNVREKIGYPALDSIPADVKPASTLECDQVQRSPLARGFKGQVYSGKPISKNLLRSASASGQSVNTMLNNQSIGSDSAVRPTMASQVLQGAWQSSTPRGNQRLLESLLSPRWSQNAWTSARRGASPQSNESSVWARAHPEANVISPCLTLEKTAYIVRGILQQLDGQPCNTSSTNTSKIGSYDVRKSNCSQPATPMSALDLSRGGTTPKLLESLATLFTQLDGRDGDVGAWGGAPHTLNVQNQIEPSHSDVDVHAALVTALRNTLQPTSQGVVKPPSALLSTGWGGVEQMNASQMNSSNFFLPHDSNAVMPSILQLLQRALASTGTQCLSSHPGDSQSDSHTSCVQDGDLGRLGVPSTSLFGIPQSKLKCDGGNRSINHVAPESAVKDALAAVLQYPLLPHLLNQALNYQ